MTDRVGEAPDALPLGDRTYRKYVIPGQPVPYDRAADAVTKEGRRIRVHTKRYGGWRKQAAKDIGKQGMAPAGEIAVRVRVTASGVTVEVWSAKRTRPKYVRGDVDNYAKAALDAMQSAGVITNDSLVQALTVEFGE